ncbi:hypothetical protein [Bacillus sp. T33-2]|uniref:hypothetical protein n=1 Tax=Bacillus sp. T33-2 TaxID=2054168 RepID=UPI000C78E7F6|nr:hypothetical protein [Bacillus sp. T33-2]PLR99562.1 hypothetical protein CVD19_00430 [Bacillus sp. T33-2]
MNKLYGIDYNVYVCGGIGDQKLQIADRKTVFFYTESEMLRNIAELKENYSIGEIKPFSTNVTRDEYKIS